MPSGKLSGHSLDQFSHANHLVRADVGELHLGESVIEELLGISRRVNQVSALDTISCTQSQLLAQGLQLFECSPVVGLEINGGVPKHSFTQCIKESTGELAPLRKKPNTFHAGVSSGCLNRDCQRCLVSIL
jgi:hypothetical protein